jgi:hypothetical protein
MENSIGVTGFIEGEGHARVVRFATFSTSLFCTEAGQLIDDLSTAEAFQDNYLPMPSLTVTIFKSPGF